LGLKLLEYLAEKDACISEWCYRTLIELISRECLNLPYIKFQPNELQQIANRPKDSLSRSLKVKIEIRVKY
jgi:hypothetical protein